MTMLEANKTYFHETNNQVTAYLFERARPEVIISLIAALVVAWFSQNLVEQTTLLSWASAALLIYLFRFVIIRGGKNGEVKSTRSFLFILTLALSGVLWGAAGYFSVPHESVMFKTGILTVVVCLCFLVTMIYSGKISYFLAFAVPALGLSAYPMLGQNSGLLYALLATGGFLFLLSVIYHNSFLSGLQLRTEHAHLRAQHDSLLEESRKTDVSLKSSIQKNDEIQANLSKTSENLSQCVNSKETLVSTLKTNLRTDPITNLSNRKDFIETVTEEWQRSTRSKEPLTVAFINVDEFDTLSKEKDKKTVLSTLKNIGESIKSHGRRAGDLPARFDKSGFALLLLGADAKDASKIVENVRLSINDKNLSVNNNGDPVTVHAGVATLVPSRKSSPEELFNNVESAAFEASFQGGDRVVSFHSFQNIDISLWDPIKDGELNEANFQQKQFSLGYNTKRELIPPKTSFRDQRFSKPVLFAVYSGTFLMNIEGQSYELKRGSSLVLPENVSLSAEVVGDVPVILYLEKR